MNPTPWWQTLIEWLGLPALKFALTLLESKYPGLKPYIDEILKYLNGFPQEQRGQAVCHLRNCHAAFLEQKPAK